MAKDQLSRLKRSKTSKLKPYERQTSLLRKVADKVYDYLPSWLNLQSWSSNTSETKSVTEQTPEEEEEEDDVVCVDEVSGQDDLNRAGTSTGIRGNVPVNPDITSYTRCPLPRTSAPTTLQPLANGDDQSDNSESSASTSGCSSLAPSQKKLRLLRGLPVSEAALVQIKKDLSGKVSSLGKRKKDASVLADLPDTSRGGNETPSSRTSLWSEDEGMLFPKRATRPQPISSGNKPSFRVSSFGAPIPANGMSSFIGSPFYAGRTTFGGSSAQNVSRLSPAGRGSAFYQDSRCSRPQVTVRERSSEDCISTTAKRILNTLERMTTPLSDVKKIPSEKNSVDFALSFTPSTYRRRVVSGDRLNRVSRMGPPVRGVGTPYPTVVSRIPKVDSIREEKSLPPPTSIPSASQSEEQLAPRKPFGKMTRPHKRAHYSAKPETEDDVEVPDLPDIPLPALTTMPRFNFPSATVVTSTPIVPPEKSDTPKSQPQFSFASPIQHGAPTPPSANQVASTGQPFVFSSPVIVTSSEEIPKINFADTALSNGSRSPVRLITLKAKVAKREEDSVPGGIKPAAELILGGSVMDILGGKTSKKSESEEKPKSCIDVAAFSTSGFGNKFQPPAGSWTCGTCMISNKPEATKCAACETSRPSGFGNKFAPAAGSWTCATCMISNRSESLKCAACETPKPGASIIATTTSTSEIPKPTTAGFGNKFSPPSNSWECDACLVRNKADASRCIACETPMSTVEKTAGIKGNFTGFKFGNLAKTAAPSPAAFKFGMSTATSTSTAASFKFGVASLEKTSKSDVPFGSPLASSGGTDVKIGNADKKPDFTFGTTSETSGLKFGESKPNLVVSDPVKLVPSSGDDVATGFKFADATTTKPNTTSVTSILKSVISAEPVATTTASGGFKFGLTSATETASMTFGKPAPKKASTDFKFGATEAASSVGGSSAKPEEQLTSTANRTAGGFKFTQVKPTDSFQFGVPVTSSSSKTEVKFASAVTKQSGADEKKNLEGKSSFTFGQTARVVPEFKSSETVPISTVASFQLPAGNTKPAETAPTSFGVFQAKVPTTEATSLPLPITTTASSSVFAFFGGASKGESKPTAAAPVFAFGQAKTDPPTKSAASFTFGDKPPVATTTAAASTIASVVPASTFVFAPAGFSVNEHKKTSKSSEVGDAKIAAVAPSFSFGAPTSTQSIPVRLNFEFGAGKVEQPQAAPAPVGGFKFNLGSTPTAGGTTSGVPLTFGGFGTPAAGGGAPGGGFTFGAQAATTTTSSAFGGPATATVAPTFGGQSSFGAFGSPATPFGQTQEAAVGSTTVPNYRFNPSSDSSLFRFGAQQEPVPSGGFSFGTAAAPAAQPNSGFNFSASTAVPSFNFGQQQPTSATPFQFSSSSESSFNPGAASAGAQAAGARRIRRAVRRTKK